MTTSWAASGRDSTAEAVGADTIWFGDLRIDFDARVLRPRPWTMSQSRWSAELLRSVPPGPVLELCAGAGQIGLLALALADEERELGLGDVDEVACTYARSNARHSGLAGKVSVRCAPVEEALAPHERFAFIIADPPWVPSGDVTRYPDDPVHAIDGGADGLTTAWECLDVVATHLRSGGSAVVQLGTEEQARSMRRRLDTTKESELTVAEVRSPDAHGVLVRLRHSGTE